VALLTGNGCSGVPWELVKDMDRVDRLCWLIVLGELQGHKWDWGAFCWREVDRR